MSERAPVRLGDVISIKHGFAFPGDGFVNDPRLPTLVTPGNFSIGGGFKHSRPKTFKGDFPEEYRLHSGDLLISMTDLSKDGATLGLPALVPADGVYLHNQRIGLVRIKDPLKVCRRFLNYFFRTAEYRSHVLNTASGSTVRHTSPSRISEFVAALPDLNEQRAIAEVLGALDDKIAANATLGSTAIGLASSLFDQATVGMPRQSMSSALQPVLGGTPSRSRVDFWSAADRPWASARDVASASLGVVLDTAERISDRAATETKAKPLPRGSVVLTARGTVGAVARLGEPMSFNQSCYGFVPGRLTAGVLYFSILRATERAKAMAHGSVFDTITMRTFDHLEIPDLADVAMTELERQIAPPLGIVEQQLREIKTLAALRDALLPELMSGRIRVKDAERVVEGVV